MSISTIVRSLLNLQKKLDVKKLPSQGLFYKDDFEISIKRADMEDIIEYEHNYVKDSLGLVITKLKKVVEKNTIFSDGYSFLDVKSVDVIYIFFEIVKFTKGKSVQFNISDIIGVENMIEFDSNNFNYFNMEKLMKYYNNKEKCFTIDGYKYTLPSIGLENYLTSFLIENSDNVKYDKYHYDFIYFLGDKSYISFDEIENLIQIFNFDMEQNELNKIGKIIKLFIPLQKYSLKRNGKVIDINSKIDLERIWK